MGKAVHATAGREESVGHYRKLKVMKEEHGLMQLFKRIGYFVLVIVGQFLLFWGTNWLFHVSWNYVLCDWKKTRLEPSFGGMSCWTPGSRWKLLIFPANHGTLCVYVPAVAAWFAAVLHFSRRLRTWPLAAFHIGIGEEHLPECSDYLPNLFTIFVIYTWPSNVGFVSSVTWPKITVRTVEIERILSRLGDAYLSYCPFLLYAFMIAMIYPYLPGSNSGVFRNIRICRFDLSLVQSTVISSILPDWWLPMRPFKIGDRIKLNDTMGNVVENSAGHALSVPRKMGWWPFLIPLSCLRIRWTSASRPGNMDWLSIRR